ncbi:Scr1 family TA system antitoxin-like transcriptional regulator [Streptomyces sp. NPDC059467]|uniref:Scr1 family TA system antitoxin-like transcriptional regulator n=1 Tax=Streptomyces sp. NPDC059467 TaxID=3346844 RepID=UPI0036BB82B9
MNSVRVGARSPGGGIAAAAVAGRSGALPGSRGSAGCASRNSLTQLRYVLDQIDAGHAAVRVIPVDCEGFAGAGASMMYSGGPVPTLDTGLRDSPAGAGFCDAEAQLEKLRTLFRQVKSASLDPAASRDLIHRVAKEL